jgi:hypothetical protein
VANLHALQRRKSVAVLFLGHSMTIGNRLWVKNEVNSPLVLRNLRNQIAHTGGDQIGWEDAVKFENASE